MKFNLQHLLDQNDIKKEDAYRYDDNILIVVDGATGFSKEICKDGTIKELPPLVLSEQSPARIWAENLAEDLLLNARESTSLVNVLRTSVASASQKMSAEFVRDFADYETPSAAVLIARVKGEQLEILSSGDCGLLVKYTDGTFDALCGSKILENIRKAREEKIKKLYPDFADMSKNEQVFIRTNFMKETRASLGDAYFVPHYNADIDKFCNDGLTTDAHKNNHTRSINRYNKGDIWELLADANKVEGIVLSTDGFLERLLKNKLLDDISCSTMPRNPSLVEPSARRLRAKDMGLSDDVHSVAMKALNQVKNTGSADDAVALFATIDKSEISENKTMALQLYNKSCLTK